MCEKTTDEETAMGEPAGGQSADRWNFRDAGPHSALQLISQWTGFRNLPFREHNTGGGFVESAVRSSGGMASEDPEIQA